MLRQIPNVLTILRILLALAGATALWLSWSWSQSHDVPGWMGDARLAAEGMASFAVAAFIIAALSDWLDGALARRWSVESRLGAFLDPIADKLLVDGYLLVYALILQAPVELIVPVGAIILRDVVMTASRIGRPVDGTLKVSMSGKLKTAIAMGVTAFPLIAVPMGWSSLDWVLTAWIAGIWLTAALSLLTAINYIRPKRR